MLISQIKSAFNAFSAILLGALIACPALSDVYISEFMADNSSSLQTAEGIHADWIELHNPSAIEADISGWFLTDDIALPTQWAFPPETRMAPNSWLIIFADGSEHSITNNELHTNFKLSKSGEYLALIQADGITVACEFAPAFPTQYSDVSYGLTTVATTLIGTETPARYRVPNASGSAPWNSAMGGLGFTAAPSTFTVKYYEMNKAVASVGAAETMIKNPSDWKTTPTFPLVEQFSVINMHGTSSNGNFGNDDPFPNHGSVGVDKNNFVVVAETVIYIPAAGFRSFGVASDDGFALSITGQGQNFGMEHPTPRGCDTTISAFNFPAAGYYNLRLIFFEQTGGATLELSCALGSYASFDGSAFKLLGDPTAAVLLGGSIGAHVNTDVRSDMLNINSRLDAEWSFELPPTLQPDDTISFALRYLDGCAVTVNGVPLASFNAPAPLNWNSAATASRTLLQGLTSIPITIPYSAITPGSNTLTITALNDSVANTDFLIQPTLTHTSANRYGRYFPEPTPGAANGQYCNAPTPAVSVTEPRGFKSAPFWTELLCPEAPTAEIRYTTDGSVPTMTSQLYTVPLQITTTTTLRAAVVDPQSFEQRTKSVSWIFLGDVLAKDSSTPAGWPSDGTVNNKMEYGMAQNIVTGDRVRLLRGMTNDIPSISIVTDLKHLFNPQTGIYVNPGNDGITWERPVSVEMIDTARGTNYEFQVNAGLRIRGAFSRDTKNPKHSFRLFFRSVYGDSKLRFNLFDEEGTDNYDNVDLRTAQNYSWAYQNSDRNTFAREVFSRDTQRDMGTPYTRSRYYHLYLNGQYWGLYQTQERGNADFAESYLSGKSEDYDCVKVSSPGYVLATSDGNFDAYNALHNLAVNQGFAGAYSDNYWTAQGRDSNGAVNMNKPCYLDQDNLINYMLNCYYTADPDSPISAWGGIVNNIYALFNRNNPAGFTWLRHDSEHSLGANTGYGVNSDLTMLGSNFTAQNKFNPATLHLKLCAHPEYRMRFADLAYKHLFNAGALTPEQCRARFLKRTAQIDSAIVAESARWGHGKTRTGHWIPACNIVLDTFLPFRGDVIIGQFKANGWYPQLNPPLLSTNSATVLAGYELDISATNTFYYTNDGSDPRLIGGGINPASTPVILANNGPTPLIAKGDVWRFYDLGAEPPLVGSLNWREAAYSDGSWASGPGILGFAGSGYPNPVATTTRRYVNGSSGTQVTTTYFRRSFNLASTRGISSLTFDLLLDDGAVITINGIEVVRHNMPAGTITYATWSASTAGGSNQQTYFPVEITDLSSLRTGANVIAVELHQCNPNSTDLYLDLALTAHRSGNFTTMPIESPTTIKARAFADGSWSALAEVALDIVIPPHYYNHLKVTELMYAPTAPIDPVSPLKNDDFAWLELRNTGSTLIDLNGISFASGITHTFAPYNLLPGARLVLAKNPGALAQRHPTNTMQVLAWSSGNLARKGEVITIVSPLSSNILSFTYSNLWYPETYNTDRSIVVVDTAASEPLWSTAENWRPSRVATGSPGNPDAPIFNALAMTPADYMTVSTEGLEGTIELWYSEDLESWSPCDSQLWSRDNDTILIHIKSSLLPRQDRGFFQLRIKQQ